MTAWIQKTILGVTLLSALLTASGGSADEPAGEDSPPVLLEDREGRPLLGGAPTPTSPPLTPTPGPEPTPMKVAS